MNDVDECAAAPGDDAQGQAAMRPPWLTDRLTEAEIEALRQDQNEALAYAQKAFFPNAKIHRAKENPAEEPKE